MKHHYGRRAAALALALLMTAGSVSASEALGWDLHTGKMELSEGTELEKNVFWSDTFSDLRTEHFVTYRPGEKVRPKVTAGSSVMSVARLTDLAAQLQAQGQRLVSAVNGDYFVMTTGAPVGLVLSGGKLLATPTYSDGLAIGFYEDGTAFIGTPGLEVTIQLPEKALPIRGGVNKIRQVPQNGKAGGLTLLTDDFSPTTRNTEPGVDVVLVPAEPDRGLTIGGVLECTVEQVLESPGSIAIPEGRLVLTVNARDDAAVLETLRKLNPGDRAEIQVTSGDERWTRATEGIGSLARIVSEGKVLPSQDRERTARSAVGIRPDGTVIFYTIDGKRPGYSVGAELDQVARRLVELGCTEAASLDGGGSTTLGAVRPGDGEMSLVNRPSGLGQRLISTAVFLTTSLRPTGVRGSYAVTPSDAVLLSGASVQLNAAALDTGYYPTASGAVQWTVEGGGTVSPSGLYTAGPESGQSLVTAEDGTASGTAWITTVATPDRITLTDEKTGRELSRVNLPPETQIDLKAAATYRKMQLQAEDRCFTWKVDPAVGSITGDGLLTVGKQRGSGVLTVTAGEKTLEVPVRVAGHILPAEGFEAGAGTFGAPATVEKNLDRVRYGRQSLRVDYDASAGSAELTADLTIPAGERYLSLWVRSDGSGNLLLASLEDSKGGVYQVPMGTLNDRDWHQLRVQLPPETVRLKGLSLVCTGPNQTGTFWLDQVTTATEDVTDQTPPSVTVSYKDHRLEFSAIDDLNLELPAEQIRVLCDGAELPAEWNREKGTGKASLTGLDDGRHRISVIASDASGNLARASVDLTPVLPEPKPETPELIPEESMPEETGADELKPEPPALIEPPEPVFGDIEGHWSGDYASYLLDRGISYGVEGADGVLKYQPDQRITRAEFFALTARWMGLDLSLYRQTELPFADAESVPDWARSEISAMYSLGILKGSPAADGSVRVNPTAQISRAEVMTILGRTQPRGYAEPPLTFDDAGQVPEWSLPYVKSLVGQGVVGGFGNRIHSADLITRGEVAKMLYTMR